MSDDVTNCPIVPKCISWRLFYVHSITNVVYQDNEYTDSNNILNLISNYESHSRFVDITFDLSLTE